MPFTWITDVGTDDDIEGWPTGFGDVREMRKNTDYIFLNTCYTDCPTALAGEDSGVLSGANTSQDSGDESSYTCGSNNLDNSHNLDQGDYLDRTAEDTGYVNGERVSEQTDRTTNLTSEVSGVLGSHLENVKTSAATEVS